MTKAEFRRLRAGNLVQESLLNSVWVVVERRKRERPCVILARAEGLRPRGWELKVGLLARLRAAMGRSPRRWVGGEEHAWTVPEAHHANFQRLA